MSLSRVILNVSEGPPMAFTSGNYPTPATMASGNCPNVAIAQVTGNRGCFAIAQHDKGKVKDGKGRSPREITLSLI
ncbi:hypothetical protein [Coprobacter tertius]|uniref:Uncharacterized protein n=1 Tax=Coprobacter tertius TaxID=2944915 RepID=A0ABT1MP91_9BACT|nr:hypothetical protein [Coprobacter tertius]MCP9613101.1 hypothetical protein [Coprobacter tertius]